MHLTKCIFLTLTLFHIHPHKILSTTIRPTQKLQCEIWHRELRANKRHELPSYRFWRSPTRLFQLFSLIDTFGVPGAGEWWEALHCLACQTWEKKKKAKKKKDFIVPHVKTLTVPCYRDIFKRFNLDVDVIEAKQSWQRGGCVLFWISLYRGSQNITLHYILHQEKKNNLHKYLTCIRASIHIDMSFEVWSNYSNVE